MDWRRFKTIIIVVLIIINIFFGAYLIRMKWADSSVNRETRANVIAVLEKSNIILEEDKFPKGDERYSACYLTRVLASDDKFIKRITGESGKFEEKNEVFSFEFSSTEKMDLAEEKIISSCRNFMNNHGIFGDLYKAGKTEIVENNGKVRFYLEYDGSRFFDSYLDFYFSKDGIYKLCGKNIIKAEENINSYEEKMLPAESIAVTVARDKKTDKTVKIKNMTFGYYLGKSEGVYVSVLAIPVWKIDFSDGDSLSYDARNGSLINL